MCIVQCYPFKERSCCTSDVEDGIMENKNWLNFNWHHCRQLSSQCTEQFQKELCFYECSPNIGPFIQPVSFIYWLHYTVCYDVSLAIYFHFCILCMDSIIASGSLLGSFGKDLVWWLFIFCTNQLMNLQSFAFFSHKKIYARIVVTCY